MVGTDIGHGQLRQLLVVYVATGKERLAESDFAALDLHALQSYISKAHEAIPFERLMDRNLMLHALEKLSAGHTVEETLLHVFLLYIYLQNAEGSAHPLERGILKQKIQALIPIFARATEQGRIREEQFERNADALLHFAAQSEEVPELMLALQEEYERLSAC